MKLRVFAAAQLASVILIAAVVGRAEAQTRMAGRSYGGPAPAANYASSSPAYYQSPTPAEGYMNPRSSGSAADANWGAAGSQPSGSTSGSASKYYNPQPQPVMTGSGQPSGQQMYSDGQAFSSGSMMGGGYYGDGCDCYGSDGCSTGYGCECGDSCGSGVSPCWSLCGMNCDPLGCLCPPGRYFVTADYLYVRSNFSESVAFLNQDDSDPNIGRDDFHSLDFRYESSYRVGGGYKLCDCNEEVRFMFTRLGSHGSAVAPSGTFLPYEVSSPPNGHTDIDASVDVKSWDLSFAKMFPLGGSCGCGDSCGCDPCGSACGCGDSCGCGGCPKWELTWSGGMRFADADWRRAYVAVNDVDILQTNATAVMNFRGGGLRTGLEGRRYFGDGGMLSAYVKGDISLLLGDLDLVSHRTVVNQPDIDNFQTFHTRQIVPVTELETGLTGQVTCNTTITAGYLFSAWHDLGFRDEFNFPTFMETRYDDGNILGFDGFFARLEVAF